MTLAHKSVVAALVVAATLGMAGCGDGGAESGPAAKPKDTKLKTAFDKCDPQSGVIELGDGNRSLLIQGAGATADTGDAVQTYTDAVASLGEVECLYDALSTPQYVMQEIQATTAMMGRQKEEDGGISYDWSYHPDNGLDMTIHETD